MHLARFYTSIPLYLRERPRTSAISDTDSHPHPAWLLVSDIDDTLLGDDQAFRDFVTAVAAAPALLVVLNSSRPAGSVQSTLRTLPLPFEPHGLITAMGTEIVLGGIPAPGWKDRFTNWNRSLIDAVMTGLGTEPHAAEYQTPYKASFAVPPDRQAEARERLTATGLDLRIIASGASDFDILPARAGKGEATLHAATCLGIDPAQHLVVAGDSGNDLAMFDACPRGVVVGNARDELRNAVDPARAYHARATHAAGILEGLRHWGALPTESSSS